MIKMKYWIEVASGDRAWLDKIAAPPSLPKRGLIAPNKVQYLRKFKQVDPEDIVLTYLTSRVTENNDWKSSIIGLSLIQSQYRNKDKAIVIDTYYDTQLPIPISYLKFKNVVGYSDQFKELLSMNMQRYLSEISREDFLKLIKLNMENFVFLKDCAFLSL
jgi:hypothetical protein